MADVVAAAVFIYIEDSRIITQIIHQPSTSDVTNEDLPPNELFCKSCRNISWYSQYHVHGANCNATVE